MVDARFPAVPVCVCVVSLTGPLRYSSPMLFMRVCFGLLDVRYDYISFVFGLL